MQYHLGGDLVLLQRLKTGGEASKSALQKEPSHQWDKSAQIQRILYSFVFSVKYNSL